jgi:hypothetical protein
LQVAGLVVIERIFDEKAGSVIEILFRLAVAGGVLVKRLRIVLREHL